MSASPVKNAIVPEILSLKKKTKTKVTKKVNKITTAKKSKDAIVKQQRGLVYIGHLPHGFFETELKAFFRQFGKVTNARVSRSIKTGRSKGYGYVEFFHPEVAQIAAETMHNYLMFKRKIVTTYIPPDEQKDVFSGRPWSTECCPRKMMRSRQVKVRNTNSNIKEYVARGLSKMKKKLEILQELGINHSVKPVSIPEEKLVLCANSRDTIYCVDPNDSQIEIKVNKSKTNKKNT